MKNKIKYSILFLCIFIVVGLFYANNKVINLKPLKGSFVIWASKENYKYLEESSKEFMETNKKVSITVKEKSKDEIINYIEKGSSSDDAPSVVSINSKDLRNLSNKGMQGIASAHNIIDSYGKTFNSWRLNEISVQDDLLAIPIENNPVFMFLRKDILDQYGYKVEDIRTWKELLDVSKDIKNKSSGKISLLNYSYVTLDSLRNIMLYQAGTDKNIKETLDFIKNNDLMGKGTTIAYIATKDNYNNIIDASNEDTLTAVMLPAFEIGGNRAASLDGENLAIVKSTNEKQELATRFITYSINNQSLMEKFLKENTFFPSSVVFYKNSIVDTEFSKVNNDKVWSLMANICNRNYTIDDYKKLDEQVKKESMDK
ncbi:ABC transporter substrate-binding protein [Clostridium paridis]|uniref:Carbohydrate ABC transporter substrate-binding protein n=1 Tax=Clostridium paridis TaxID=2803863 RepID=A0A937K5S9_9CLOT|nr:ABC transporter substrate-binding protein [Clostridium paridis]MBL4932715.1 carbohydrate ABC transporter substrate-binding protein [Clostridium paridis]